MTSKSRREAEKELTQAVRQFLVEERAGSLFDDEVRASVLQHFAGAVIATGGDPIDIIHRCRRIARNLFVEDSIGQIIAIVALEYPDVHDDHIAATTKRSGTSIGATLRDSINLITRGW